MKPKYDKRHPIISFRVPAEIRDLLKRDKRPLGVVVKSIIIDWYYKNKDR